MQISILEIGSDRKELSKLEDKLADLKKKYKYLGDKNDYAEEKIVSLEKNLREKEYKRVKMVDMCRQ